MRTDAALTSRSRLPFRALASGNALLRVAGFLSHFVAFQGGESNFLSARPQRKQIYSVNSLSFSGSFVKRSPFYSVCA